MEIKPTNNSTDNNNNNTTNNNNDNKEMIESDFMAGIQSIPSRLRSWHDKTLIKRAKLIRSGGNTKVSLLYSLNYELTKIYHQQKDPYFNVIMIDKSKNDIAQRKRLQITVFKKINYNGVNIINNDNNNGSHSDFFFQFIKRFSQQEVKLIQKYHTNHKKIHSTDTIDAPPFKKQRLMKNQTK